MDSLYFVKAIDKNVVTAQYKYYCSCDYQSKTGMPCCHILKVMYYVEDKDILSQVNKFHVIENPTELKECVYDLKCEDKTIKPGTRKGRPTVFMRMKNEKQLPTGVIKVEKVRKKKNATETR